MLRPFCQSAQKRKFSFCAEDALQESNLPSEFGGGGHGPVGVSTLMLCHCEQVFPKPWRVFAPTLHYRPGRRVGRVEAVCRRRRVSFCSFPPNSK